jgi:hypothetical protein
MIWQIGYMIAYLMGLSLASATWCRGGWSAPRASRERTTLIPVAWALTLAWIIWLVIVAWRMRDADASLHVSTSSTRTSLVSAPIAPTNC